MNQDQDPVLSKIKFEGKDVLEVGSGYGSFTFAHLLTAKSVICMDTDPDALDYLENNWPVSQENQQVSFLEGDIVNANLKGKEFDVVIFSNSF